jgi:hypothetical protein
VLAHFFSDAAQILLTTGAMLVRFGQIMLDALALQMRRQRTPSPRAPLFLNATAGAGRKIIVVF